MWLDRLSGHSTPAATPSASPPPPAHRSYSPAPRRPSNLAPSSAAQRPAFNPRSSSLSLISNDSTTSLLSSSRRPNGSGLKQSVTAVVAPDPLEVLERLLGSEGKEKRYSKATNGVSGKNTVDYDFEAELDFDGLSLRQLVEGKLSATQGDIYPTQTVEECTFDHRFICMVTNPILVAKEKEKFEDLHKSIRVCDDVLNSVEINLTSFQNDLAAVSTEIETLQARSTALGVRLENRKVVENGLGPIVEEISVSPAVVRKIVDGAIDEAWVRALAEVEKRSKALDSKSKEHRNIKGVSDLRPLLENLINKVRRKCLFSICKC